MFWKILLIIVVSSVFVNAGYFDKFHSGKYFNEVDGKIVFEDGSFIKLEGDQIIEFHRNIDQRLNNIVDEKNAREIAYSYLEFVPSGELEEFSLDENVPYYDNIYHFNWFRKDSEYYILDEFIFIDVRVDGILMDFKYNYNDNVKNLENNITINEAINISEENSLNMTNEELNHNIFLDKFEAVYNNSLSWVIMVVGSKGQRYAAVNNGGVYYPEDLRIPSEFNKTESRFFWLRIFFDGVLLYLIYRLFFKIN